MNILAGNFDIFATIFDSTSQSISPLNFIICLLSAIVLGVVLAFLYTFKTRYTKSFFITLSVLPAVVCVVIMMVNGSIGAGIAVAGAFSLVRFRSAPGTAKEIVAIFLAMGTGLILGMGYIAYAVLFGLVLSLVMMLLTAVFNTKATFVKSKTLKITIPEDLNYTQVFEPVLTKYASSYELINVKTANLGSLFKLTYNLTLKDANSEKELIDELRIRNGNLEVAIMQQETNNLEL